MEALRAIEAARLEIAVTEQQVGGRWTVEAEAAFAAGVQCNEGQRGLGRVGTHDVVGTDAVFAQALSQEVAEHVAAEHADELGLRAQPCSGHRDVGRCTAGVLQERARGIGRGRRLR
ncbi:hypothetical protein D3C72_1018800 [compost metagenome]